MPEIFLLIVDWIYFVIKNCYRETPDVAMYVKLLNRYFLLLIARNSIFGFDLTVNSIFLSTRKVNTNLRVPPASCKVVEVWTHCSWISVAS